MGNELLPQGEILFYNSGGEKEFVSVVFKDETFWLSQKGMAELFETSKQNISLHLKNCFDEEELDKESVVKDFLTTAADGKNYKTQHYNLDAIIAVGYRVNMGLTTWKGASDGKILKSDVLVAKNYLNEKEIARLNRLVTMFIDYAELMAEDEQLMSMKD